MKRVLFVCTANVCRSPVAAVLWSHAARRRGLNLAAASAGLWAVPGQSAHARMQAIAAGNSIDLSIHRARAFTRLEARTADFILAMDHGHVREILARAPELAGRVYLLGHWGEGELADPVRGEFADFVDAYEWMECAVESWMDCLAAPRGRVAAYA